MGVRVFHTLIVAQQEVQGVSTCLMDIATLCAPKNARLTVTLTLTLTLTPTLRLTLASFVLKDARSSCQSGLRLRCQHSG